MTIATLDATAELEKLRRNARECRHRRTWGCSRLVPYRAELTALRKAGGSWAELTAWLRTQRVKVDRSTVRRYVQKLPEMAADGQL